MGLPTIPVEFFTPLLGAMLLNTNAEIQESVRGAVISVIARLRGKGDHTAERWGARGIGNVDERKIFANQNGPHSHDIRPMPTIQRDILERELLAGIVIGMGQLSIEMPEHLFAETTEGNGQTLEDYSESLGVSREHGDIENMSEAGSLTQDREAFQIQLIQEASAGRATSMNLIGALCEFYTGEEVVERGFIDEVLGSGDGDVAVRAEGAVALSLIAKVAPIEDVYRMVCSH